MNLHIESYMAKNIGLKKKFYVFARRIVLKHRRENIELFSKSSMIKHRRSSMIKNRTFFKILYF